VGGPECEALLLSSDDLAERRRGIEESIEEDRREVARIKESLDEELRRSNFELEEQKKCFKKFREGEFDRIMGGHFEERELYRGGRAEEESKFLGMHRLQRDRVAAERERINKENEVNEKEFLKNKGKKK